MKNRFSISNQFRCKEDYSEFEIFDGEDFIKFNIINFDLEQMTVTMAVTNRGKISNITYDLIKTKDRIYFEYGSLFTEIDLEEFCV